MNKKNELDIAFIMSTVLNVLFLVGLTFLVQLENLGSVAKLKNKCLTLCLK
ncbi:TPA: hypothetical protein OVM58_002773 [Staphylococcus aureus]|uniref:hypothetical protein n=1 Tax=Staphylococcus aureus TaxID=1280 RepID=UPI0015E18B20|nr:hypothetical protein [Staphylococcus aureus]HCV0622023.1 hypothetical protein [Staphylococcus aureus]HDI8053287.1 hypothetical protein [Staphylococcus aureus]